MLAYCLQRRHNLLKSWVSKVNEAFNLLDDDLNTQDISK